MRIQGWTLVAAAIPLFAACSHAKPAVKAEAQEAPPAVAIAPAPATPVAPAPPAPMTCSADDQCGAKDLCVRSQCVAITPELAECRSVSTHFDYDRADLHAGDLPALQREARCLEALPPDPTLVAGNCDERGTVEYNLVLGLRRAHAVSRYLENLGVPERRLTEVSYGKELGICSEATEACWSQNRRTDVERGAKAHDIAALIRADEVKEHRAIAQATSPAKGHAMAAGRRTPAAKHGGPGAAARTGDAGAGAGSGR